MVPAGQGHELRVRHQRGRPGGLLVAGMVLAACHPQRGNRAALQHLVRHGGGGVGRREQRRDRLVVRGEEGGARGARTARGDLRPQPLTGAERLHALLADRVDHAREEHRVHRAPLRGGRAAEAHQARDQARMRQRRAQRDACAERVAHQRRAADPLRVEHGEQVLHEDLLRVRRGVVGLPGAAVAAQVHPEHGVLGGERFEIAEAPPDRAGEHRAVQQHQRRPVPGDVVAQVDAVDGGGDDGHGAVLRARERAGPGYGAPRLRAVRGERTEKGPGGSSKDDRPGPCQERAAVTAPRRSPRGCG